MFMANLHTPKRIQLLPLAIIKNMIVLSTSGFGLVVALAWNEFIQSAVEKYINPYLGKNSGIISLFIYAIAMTVLAVVVTMQLTAIQHKLEEIEERNERKRLKTSAKK
jgi:hypothetical protein